MLVTLDPAVDRGVLTVAPTAAGRGWNLDWLDRWLARAVAGPRARAALDASSRTSAAALETGRRQGAGTVLVTGSFHTVGDVMAAELGARALSFRSAGRIAAMPPLTPSNTSLRLYLVAHATPSPAGISRLLPG